MRKYSLLLTLVCLLASSQVFAQTGTVQGSCASGGTQAKVSGLSSTNYLQGIIPSCTVTVYVHGTLIKATIYADALNTPLANPFTANAALAANPGGWLFWSSLGQGYDVVMSGGISPNIFPSPVTLTGVFAAGAGGGGGSGITQLIGDVLAGPGVGAVNSTLATVNSSVGSFGSSTAIPNFTANGKGQITAAGSNVVIAPAGTLTGNTLAPNVLNSSLNQVGMLTVGTWNATPIGILYGGTGLTAIGNGCMQGAGGAITFTGLPCGSGGGSGLTSIGLSDTAGTIYTFSNNPRTTNGLIGIGFSSQAAKEVLATGPIAGVPSFGKIDSSYLTDAPTFINRTINNSILSSALQGVTQQNVQYNKLYFTDGTVGYHAADPSVYPNIYISDTTLTALACPQCFNPSDLKNIVAKFVALPSNTGSFPNLPVGSLPMAITPSATVLVYCSAWDTWCHHPTGDGAIFTAIMEGVYYSQTGDLTEFTSDATAIDTALGTIPIDGTTNLVTVTAGSEWIPWAFQEEIRFTGAVATGSAWYYKAATSVASLYGLIGNTTLQNKYTAIANNIKANLATVLLDGSTGLLYGAATQNHQDDIMGSSLACEFNILTASQCNTISNYLATNIGTLMYRGYFRQSPTNWPTTGYITTGGPPYGADGFGAGCYQNGGFWSATNKAILDTLNLKNPTTAQSSLVSFQENIDPTGEYYAPNCSSPKKGATYNLESPAGNSAFAASLPYAQAPLSDSQLWLGAGVSSTFSAVNTGGPIIQIAGDIGENPSIIINRNASTNFGQLSFVTGGSSSSGWSEGLESTDTSWHLYDRGSATDRITVPVGPGAITVIDNLGATGFVSAGNGFLTNGAIPSGTYTNYTALDDGTGTARWISYGPGPSLLGSFEFLSAGSTGVTTSPLGAFLSNGDFLIGTLTDCITHSYLCIVNPSTSSFVIQDDLAPGLASGQSIYLRIGAAESLNNTAEIGFTMSSTGSTANQLSLGFNNNDQLLNLFASGNVAIGTTTDTGTKLYVNGTGNFTGLTIAGDLSSVQNVISTGKVQSAKFVTQNFCNTSGSPANCGAAQAGLIAMSAITLNVNTTAVTGSSQIVIMEDASIASALGVACSNSTFNSPVYVSSRTSGSGFTVSSPISFTGNVCLTFLIVN